MKRFIVPLAFLTTSLSSFAQELSDKDKLINNEAIETLRAIEADPEHENDILNNQPTEVRDLTLSLKEQGLQSKNYVQNENGEYVHFNNLDEMSSAYVTYVTYQNHRCRSFFSTHQCSPWNGKTCIADSKTGWCDLW